jgi:hypothetical protein
VISPAIRLFRVVVGVAQRGGVDECAVG